MDTARATAADLGRAIDTGALDPRDLAEACLDAIAAHLFGPRIYARTTPGRARAEAAGAAARAKAGLRRGPLDGVPLSWKDNVDMAGVATEAGSALLAGRTPAADAAILATATLGGSVCLGKTHMSELAFSGLGLNPVTATPPCVNNRRAVPGGSSSGAAASVAFCLAPAAVGTDTGGSVRLPAAWNDLVGFKPAQGTLPMAGILPLSERFDTPGPLARTVGDAALVWALLAGAAPPDLAGATVAGARLLVLTTAALDDLRHEPAAAFEAALKRLSAAGVRLTEAEVPAVAEALAISGLLLATEAWGIWRETIEAAPEKMFPPILARFRSGAEASGADYVAAWRRLLALRAAWDAATAGYDAVVLPTSAILPPDAERLLADPAYYAAENLLALRNTRIGNLMGVAAITLPAGTPSAGLMLFAPAGAEARLLRLAAAAEAALG